MLNDRSHYYNPLLLPRQDGCVQCPEFPPPCACSSGQICERTAKTCSVCAANICIDDPNASKDSGGVSSSALAGAVVACVLVFAAVAAGFFFYRKRRLAKKALEEKNGELHQQQLEVGSLPRSVHDAPPASPLRSPKTPLHSSRPTSPREKPQPDVRFYLNGTINLDPNSAAAGGTNGGEPNPFSDSASISTSASSNVIPIAYVPPNSDGRSSSSSPTFSQHIPARPVRSPELNLRLPPNALSRLVSQDGGESLPLPKGPAYPQSTRSGVSGVSSRASIMSSASSFIYDSPTIVTSAQGRQVLGVVRAEVVQVPAMPGSPAANSGGGSTGGSGGGGGRLHPVSRARASAAAVGRSPLGAASIRREDIEMEVEPMPSPKSPESPNPFSDRKATPLVSGAISLKSTSTFGTPHTRSPLLSPRDHPLPESRPESSVGDPENMQLASVPPTPRGDTFPPQRSTPSREGFSEPSPSLPSNSTAPSSFIEEDGESILIKHGFGAGWRNSQASFMTTGSRADSILAGFPFVPPSPAGLAFSQPSTPRNVSSFGRGHAYTASQSTVGDFAEYQAPVGGADTPPPVPKVPAGVPGRRAMGFSTMSGVSTASSGLDAFTFHFGSGVPVPPSGSATDLGGGGISQHPLAHSSTASLSSGSPAMRNVVDRASLDTMTLSRDLEAYPLAFDRQQKL